MASKASKYFIWSQDYTKFTTIIFLQFIIMQLVLVFVYSKSLGYREITLMTHLLSRIGYMFARKYAADVLIR